MYYIYKQYLYVLHWKIGEKHKLAFSWLSIILISMKKYFIDIYGERYQKCMGGYYCKQ